MKISKTSWLILVAGIFIVAFASLGIARAQQLQEQDQLYDNLSVAETRLSKLELKELYSKQAGKEEQLQQALSQLEIVRDNMNYPIESIQETDILFEIADACNVKIMDITSSKLSNDKLANIDCAVLTLTARVEGEVADLINFIIKLNNDFITGVVQSTDIAIPEKTYTGTENPSANIKIIVYSYREN